MSRFLKKNILDEQLFYDEENNIGILKYVDFMFVVKNIENFKKIKQYFFYPLYEIIVK